jgi:hypothetical protein
MAELTPEEREKIYLEEKARIEVREQLERERLAKGEKNSSSESESVPVELAKQGKEKKNFPLIVLISVCFVIGWKLVTFLGSSNSPEVLPKQMPKDSKVAFIEAAGGYLKSQNSEGMKVAQAMNGLNTGETTMTEVKNSIEDSKSLVSAAWEGDYLHYGNLVVPDMFADIDKRIRRSHSLREAAYNEYLSYWIDQDTNHIKSASKTFKLSEEIAQSIVKDLTERMRKL